MALTTYSSRIAVLAGVVGALVCSTAQAADRKLPQGQQADLFRKVVDCRSIPDAQQRLACFDASVDALDQAAKSDQVVILDRAQVREARRSLFGFSLPKIRLFGSAADQDQVSQIDTVVTSITRDVNGALVFTTTEGARWHQLDDRSPFGVRSGTKVTIKKAALGSYFAAFAGSVSIKVKREN